MIFPSYIISKTANMNTRVLSQVREQLGTGAFDIEGSIDTVVERLLEEKLSYTDKGYTDITLDLDYGDSDHQSVHMYGYRPETEVEFAARIKYLDEREAEQRKKDLEQFEQLKKKLGV